MTRHSAALAVALAAVFVLAGCSGSDPATTSATTPTTATGTTTTETTDPGTSTGTTTVRTTVRRTMNETEERLRDDAVAAMDDVGTYRVASSVDRSLSANGITRTITIEGTGVFDRTARELRVNRTTSGPGGSVTEAVYLLNRSLYQHSDAYVRQYASEWITLDLSGRFAKQWRAVDTVTRQRAVLANATVEVVGTETVAGTDAYVLEADVNETTYAQYTASLLGPDVVEIEDVSITYWISVETDRPVRSAGVVNSTVTSAGQEVAVTERFTLQYSDYGAPVSVTLPANASTAVPIGNSTAGQSAALASPDGTRGAG